jgi:hypothetical protein
MLDVVWDMETADPDDFITLLRLLGHPRVRLKAVTIITGLHRARFERVLFAAADGDGDGDGRGAAPRPRATGVVA